MCFVLLFILFYIVLTKTAIIFIYGINWLIFVMNTHCVVCEQELRIWSKSECPLGLHYEAGTWQVTLLNMLDIATWEDGNDHKHTNLYGRGFIFSDSIWCSTGVKTLQASDSSSERTKCIWDPQKTSRISRSYASGIFTSWKWFLLNQFL
jgi:hypothetical protein